MEIVPSINHLANLDTVKIFIFCLIMYLSEMLLEKLKCLGWSLCFYLKFVNFLVENNPENKSFPCTCLNLQQVLYEESMSYINNSQDTETIKIYKNLS